MCSNVHFRAGNKNLMRRLKKERSCTCMQPINAIARGETTSKIFCGMSSNESAWIKQILGAFRKVRYSNL
jgi:hypothetical protein